MATWNRRCRPFLLCRRPSFAMTCAGMSRYQITVIVATSLLLLVQYRDDARRGSARGDGGDRGPELAVAGLTSLVAQAEPARGASRGSVERGVVALGQVDE